MKKNKTVDQNKKAVVYCRVSTSDQADHGQSIEAQESICTREAEKDGYTVLKVIKDEGRSGGTLKRPGIQELIRMVVAKEINAAYVIHSDRIARNTMDHIFLRNLFRENNVILKCINQPVVDDSAVSKTMDTVMASFNEMQRLITGEKVVATMYEKAKAGYFPAYPPIGYKNINNPTPTSERFSQKIVVKDELYAPFLRKAFELYATGNYNVFDVNDILYEQGFRTRKGGKLAESRLYELLKNRFYLGELHWGNIHITDIKIVKHEPLIDEYTFNRVQKILDTKNNHACRKRKYQWLLNGFLRCYKHGCRYTAEWHLKKKIAYYHCANKSGCGKYSEQTKLEEVIADKFKTLEFNPEFINKVIEKAKNIFYERRKVYDGKRQSFINQRTAFETKRKVAEDELLAKTLTREAFTRINDELTNELENIDARLLELEKNRSVNVDVVKEIISLTDNIYDTYKRASPALKKQYLGFFWDRFEVCDGLIIKSVPSILFDQLLKLEQAYQKSENAIISNVSNEVINSQNLLHIVYKFRTEVQWAKVKSELKFSGLLDYFSLPEFGAVF